MTQSTGVSIPQCFNYFRAVDSPTGRTIKRHLERHAKSRLDIPDELATAFGRALNTGDRLADPSIPPSFASPPTQPPAPNGMRRGGAGHRSGVFVRVLHSIIRHTLLPHPEWDRDKLGVPISQFGMFGTLMASSFAPGQQLKLLGYRPTDDDIVAMMHHWRYVGYLMGVESPWYPDTVTEGFQAQLMIAVSEAPNVGEDSRELCRSFMETYLPGADARGFRHLFGKLRYNAALGHARFYLGERSFEATGLPNPGRWRYGPQARASPRLTRETLRRNVPGVAVCIGQAH